MNEKLREIRKLIEDSLDTDITPSFDESIDCLYKAIDKLTELIRD